MLHLVRKAQFRIAVAISLVATLATLGVASVFAAAPSSVTIGTGSSATLGTYLTGPNGHTLYTLSSDPNNGSSCSGQCAVAWPPLLVAAGGAVTGPAGVTGSFTTFTRADATTQVAFGGRALYYFIQDTAAGQTNGEGVVAFGGTWHVVKTAAAVSSASASVGASATPISSVAGVTSGPVSGSLPPTSTASSGSDGSGSPQSIAILLALAAASALLMVALVRVRVTRR